VARRIARSKYSRSVPPSLGELNAWVIAASAGDRGSDQPEMDFADIRHWGDDRAHVEVEAQAIAQALGIQEQLRIVYTDEAPQAGGAPIPGGWDPYERHLIVSEPTWNASRGWQRLDTLAHEVMHASQTLTRADWEPRWLEMAALGVQARGAQAGTEDGLRRIWAYRTHPLEAEAIAYGHARRDQHRAH
jgi:hypothetical protein